MENKVFVVIGGIEDFVSTGNGMMLDIDVFTSELEAEKYAESYGECIMQSAYINQAVKN